MVTGSEWWGDDDTGGIALPGGSPRRPLASSPTTGRRAPVDPERVDLTVIRRRWSRRGDGAVQRGQRAQERDQRPHILLVPVRRVVPDHRLPVQGPPVLRDAAAHGARDLAVGPRAESGIAVGREIACPDGAQNPPAPLGAASAVRAMAEPARG